MHVAFLFVLFNCQSSQTETVIQDDSPRIQPIPFQITFQTKRKPVLQDAPPSSFVPPGTSNTKSFDPRGSFDPNSKSIGDDSSQRPNLGFKAVDDNVDVKPLRAKQQPNAAGTNSFSFQSETNPASSSPIGNDQKSSLGKQIQQGNGGFNATGFDQKMDARHRNVAGDTQNQFRSQSTGNTNSAKTDQTLTYESTSREIPKSFRENIDANNRQSGNKQLDPKGVSTVPLSGSSTPLSSSPLSSSPLASNREIVIEDKTYDPQLREISDLILRSIKRPVQNRFSLKKAVAYAKSASQRKQIIKQYWSCFVVTADLQFAEQEVQLLNAIPSPRTQLDQLLLRAATSSAQARVAEAKLAYEKSVSALYKLAPGFDTEQILSFADLPWIGKYTTHSEGYVKSGMFDQKIRQVDLALPAIRDLIYLRGAAVYDNLGALQESISGLDGGFTKMETVLSLHKEVRDQRIKFCKNVRAYNHAIADYAISVFPNATKPLTVANMLIDTDVTLPVSDTILDRNVRQASGNSDPEYRPYK